MPSLKRPDGAEISWEERGQGPALFFAHNAMIATPATFDALIGDLARDHRVITWDGRGIGASSPGGPYDLQTDAADLEALVELIGRGGAAVAVGANRAPLALVGNRPHAFSVVILLGDLPALGSDSDAVMDSGAVVTAALQMAKTDPRALLRSAITLGNPQMSEDEVRTRLEAQLAYCPMHTWIARAESYVGHETGPTAAALGDRLWVVSWDGPLTPAIQIDRIRELLPAAHVVRTEDGPISRPDLIAAAIREATAPLRAR